MLPLRLEGDQCAYARQESEHYRHNRGIARTSGKPVCRGSREAPALGLAFQALAFCLFGGLDQCQLCLPVLLLSLLMGAQRRLDVFNDVIVDLLAS